MRKWSSLLAVDRALSKAFSSLKQSGGDLFTQRNVYFVGALRGLAPACPGFDNFTEGDDASSLTVNLPGEAKGSMTLSDFLRIQLRFLHPFDYVAASHWSPVDKKRHTAYSTGNLDTAVAIHRTACAYLFYALTLLGGDTNKYYSVTQFIGQKSKRKNPFFTYFGDDCPPNDIKDIRWCHIPSELASRLLRELDVVELVDTIAKKWSIDRLTTALRSTLVNPQGGWDMLQGEASNYLASYPKLAGCLSSEIMEQLKDPVRSISSTFCGDRIAEKQAIYMCMTQCLWREACPTKIMYSFVLRVDESCCVFTCGRHAPFDMAEFLLMDIFTRGLFVHPLLIEYGRREEDHAIELIEQHNRDAEAYSRHLKHTMVSRVASLEEHWRQLKSIIPDPESEFVRKVETDLLFFGSGSFLLRNLSGIRFNFRSLDLAKEYAKTCGLWARFDFQVTSFEARGDCFVWGDREHLDNVLRQLLDNSADALYAVSTVRGSPKIEVNVSVNGENVLVDVRDNGPGVAYNIQDRIFEIFQAWPEPKLGLGLGYCSKVVREHGGRLELITGCEEGAHFRYSLPLYKGKDESRARP